MDPPSQLIADEIRGAQQKTKQYRYRKADNVISIDDTHITSRARSLATIGRRKRGVKTEPQSVLQLSILIGILMTCLVGQAESASTPSVGIAMPNTVETRWIYDGDELKKQLLGLGFAPDLQNAENDVAKQIEQIDAMLAQGDEALVIAPVDDMALIDVLHRAAMKGIKVIAYDRLLRGSPDVDYYVSFDSFAVGVLQAQSLVRGLREKDKAAAFDIELFGGSPNDENARQTFDGAMSVLKPLIDNGTLRIPSGETRFKDVSTLRWSADLAHARLDNLLTAYYGKRKLAGLLAPNDEIAQGLIKALQEIPPNGQIPVITGQDCEVFAVRAINDGLQYSSVFKDTRVLAAWAAQVVDTLLSGKNVAESIYVNNGVKDVPSQLINPQLVSRDNFRQLLVQSHYYSEAQLGLAN
jgi:putative multiple sugar transport system substrate-binding protein